MPTLQQPSRHRFNPLPPTRPPSWIFSPLPYLSRHGFIPFLLPTAPVTHPPSPALPSRIYSPPPSPPLLSWIYSPPPKWCEALSFGALDHKSLRFTIICGLRSFLPLFLVLLLHRSKIIEIRRRPGSRHALTCWWLSVWSNMLCYNPWAAISKMTKIIKMTKMEKWRNWDLTPPMWILRLPVAAPAHRGGKNSIGFAFRDPKCLQQLFFLLGSAYWACSKV